MRKKQMTPDLEQKICRAYAEGASVTELARKHHLRKEGVSRCLKDKGVNICLGPRRKYSLNESAFVEAHETEAGAYLLGFLFTDGYVGEQHEKEFASCLAFGLKNQDVVMVEAMRDFLGSTHPIKLVTSKGRTDARLRVFSKPLVDSLEQYGIVMRKSLIARVPDLLQENRHWWRGVIDGNGSFDMTNPRLPRLELYGTQAVCESFRTFAGKFVDSPAKPHLRRSSQCWRIRFSCSHAARLCDALYGDCTIALPRKHAKARKILAIARERGWEAR